MKGTETVSSGTEMREMAQVMQCKKQKTKKNLDKNRLWKRYDPEIELNNWKRKGKITLGL